MKIVDTWGVCERLGIDERNVFLLIRYKSNEHDKNEKYYELKY